MSVRYVLSSDGRTHYEVNDLARTCTCPDFQFRGGPCKHLGGRRAVASRSSGSGGGGGGRPVGPQQGPAVARGLNALGFSTSAQIVSDLATAGKHLAGLARWINKQEARLDAWQDRRVAAQAERWSHTQTGGLVYEGQSRAATAEDTNLGLAGADVGEGADAWPGDGGE
jgi:hypothetical protein